MMTKSSQEPQTRIQIYLSDSWNLIQTGFMLLTWIVMGIHIELVAPTMSTLAANVNVHYSGMGSVLASRGAGYLVANILGAILQNIVKKHTNGILMCGFILPAVAVFAAPFMTSIILLCVLFFIQGIGYGLTDLGGTNILLIMWGDHAAAPLNLVRLGYGIGAIFVNLLVRPFLTKKISSIDATNNGGFDSTLTSTIATETESNIFIPYSITAALCVLIAVGHIYFYMRALKTRNEKLELRQVDYADASTNTENVSRSVKNGRDSFQHGSILSILFICSVFFIFGNEQTFSKFFFTYLKFDQFNISNRAANWGIILFWLSYSIGRFIIAVLSVFISVTTCLNIAWFGALCLAIAWLVFVWIIGLSATSLFILGAVTGLVFGPIIPLTLAFFNQRLNVTPFLLALVLCGTALGITIFPKIGGLIMDRNPIHFQTLLFICTLMSIILYVISNTIYFFHQRKSVKNLRVLTTDGARLDPEGYTEEEQRMTSYLKDQDNK